MTPFREGTLTSLTHHDGRRRTALSSLLAAVALLAVLAGAERAQAGVLVASADGCADKAAARPFLPWLDPARYTLIRGGDFGTDAASWQRDGAEVVGDNEPWNVSGSSQTAALHLPSGASATSPATCVGLADPTLRLFARNRGALLGTLQVDVLFEDATGAVRSLPIGTLLGGDWAPTLTMPIVANLLALLPGEQTPVAFRFTARGGDWTIDDVYVDPWGKG